ncbi:hypothetical protein MSI_23310 [Treponema sp. JC4]|uniref:hypothetical protein n=1 Tax=Treponema sp. JC4 TaxID=1124982 RepID=UPI00025B07AD|nr:hypothetical protein [Treponema sp. JC4]EID84220.1 hypothetical protein MSI_23310 [Treponema sp. JC4]
MSTIITPEDFQNLARNFFYDEETKPLVEALENLLINSDDFTKDDFALCRKIVPPMQYMQTLLRTLRKDEKGITSKSNLKKVAEVFRRIPMLKTEDEKYVMYDKAIQGDCKIPFHYNNSKWDYYILGLSSEKTAICYQHIDGKPNALLSGEGDLKTLIVSPFIKLDFSALEEKTLEQLIQEHSKKVS